MFTGVLRVVVAATAYAVTTGGGGGGGTTCARAAVGKTQKRHAIRSDMRTPLFICIYYANKIVFRSTVVSGLHTKNTRDSRAFFVSVAG